MKCHRKDQRHRRAARARHAGFTLIEIMIVIGIIGIVLAMGAPPFVRMLQKDSLRQAVGDITEACSRARAAAILQGEATELVIRAADGQLTVAPAPDTRMEAGGAIDTIAAYRTSGWRERKAQERQPVGLGAGIV